jgi:hypothetical protein
MKKMMILMLGLISIPSVGYSSDIDQKVNFCLEQRKASIEQIQEAKFLECGFSGDMWNEKEQTQYCENIKTTPDTFNEIVSWDWARKEALENCFLDKTGIPEYSVDKKVPKFCWAKPSKSIPVKYLEDERASHSTIEYDYNLDGYSDYLFMEVANLADRKGKPRRPAYLHYVLCISGSASFKRHITDIPASHYDPGWNEMNTSIDQKGDLLHISRSYFERNWGTSDRETSYRYSKAKGKFEVVKDSPPDKESYGYTHLLEILPSQDASNQKQ